jgi:hypothetical protein
MKNALYALLLTLFVSQTQAQTKVFKEVSQDISSQLAPILQDGKLVGYLFFTTLEKSSADSFNYRVSLMDENLNDIGTVNFRQEHLDLKEVAFEQDVLCLAYVKSNFVGKQFKNGKEFRRETSNGKTSLFTQFVNLNGKIIATNNVPMDVHPESDYVPTGPYHTKLYGNGKLKQSIQLQNIPGKGFACFYGDDTRNNLLVYNASGNQIWQKQVREDATDFTMLTSGPEIDLLVKKLDPMKEGGFEILGYNTNDSAIYPKFILRDRKGNSLKVLTFENDPATGKPFVSGMIIDNKNGNNFVTGNNLRHGPYDGVFTITLNGHAKKDIQASFSYWADGSQSIVDNHGLFQEPQLYANVERSFKDFSGNTFFAACGVKRRFRYGGLAWGVVLSPLLVPPLLYLGGGLHKYAFKDVLLIKQDANGKLSLASTVPEQTGTYQFCSYPLYVVDPRSYYTVTNPDNRSDYLIINSEKNIDIYNVSQNKMARSVPRKDGNSTINVFPAKEGYVMVYEFNRKDRTTRLSIEAL